MNETVSISEASEKTGLSQRQLRTYEAKGYIETPVKIRSGAFGYRRYTPEHIQQIKIFKSFLDEGFTLKSASEKAKEAKNYVKIRK
jgi:DNA-binding transcriptional MerR regulator